MKKEIIRKQSKSGSGFKKTLKAGAGSLLAVMVIGMTGMTAFAGHRDAARHGDAIPSNEATAYIGGEKAQEIALNHAGMTGGQVVFLQTDLEWEDGLWQYDVEFYTPSGGTEYDYEIDAVKGTVLGYESEYHALPSGAGRAADTQSYIGLNQAKSAALENAGLKADQVTFKKAHLDWDDGRAEYKIKFYYGEYEYKYEIDALKGTILNFDRSYWRN